MVKDDDAVMTF